MPFRRLLLFVAAAWCISCSAQSFLQHETFNQSGVDIIDLDTLAVELSFPVIDKAGRGVSTSFAASYEGNFWYNVGTLWTNASYYGWSTDIFTVPGSSSGESQISQSKCKYATSQQPAEYITTYGKRAWTDAFGVVHKFPGTRTENDCTGVYSSYDAWSYSGDGYSIDSMSNVYDPHGIRVNTTDTSDTNGNLVTNSTASSCSTLLGRGSCFVDTTGNPVLASDGDYANPNAPIHYYYLDNSGTKQTVTVTYSTFTIQTNFGVSGVSEFGPQQHTLPTSIAYPDGTYRITYEPTPGYPSSTTARVASLTLPTGAVIRYTYPGANGSSVGDGTLNAVNRSDSNGTIIFTRTEPTSTSARTNISYPSGRTESYSFARVPLVNQAYMTTGISSQGQTSTICYSGSNQFVNPYTCATDNLYLPVTSRQITNTLDNGLSRSTTETFNSNELLTERDETDFAASSPAVIRKTLISYNTSFVNNFDRVQQVTAEDAGNNVISQTSYSYDQNTPIQTSGLPNHTVPSVAPGNVTSVSVYNSGGSALVTNYTLDDAGQVRSVSGPGPGQTSFQYDPTESYTTQTTMPQTGSVTLSTQAAHNAYTGQLASETDANGHKTLYSYDSSLRLTSTTNDSATGGDGAVETHTYNASNVQVGTTHTIGNGSSIDKEAFTDGYGRQIRTAQATGSGSWIFSDTCYDGDGRVSFRSLPYASTSPAAANVCSGAGDTYAYDSNGRVQTITHSDSSRTTYTYLGRAVKVMDEGASGVYNMTVLQRDGLGRLGLVCEYSAGSGLVGSPAAVGCGSDINASGPDASATGYVTQYSYNLSSRTMSAAQSGATRTWQYDSLGRLILDQVPERAGATTFSYTYKPTGLQVVRSKLAPNQSWGTTSPTSVTTTSQTDALGRPLSIGYSDGVTPGINYTYDTGLASPQSHNMLGQLASATAGPRVQQFSYTSNGQMEWERSCLSSTCANSTPTFVLQNFSYNQLQGVTAAGDGAGNSIGYQYDSYGRLSSVSEAIQSVGFPASLLNGFNYGPFGVTSVSFGNGLSGSYGFDTRGRPNSFYAKTSSQANVYGFTLTWGANGSLIHSIDTQNDTWTYTYDEFNRLKTAATNSNSQGYSYQYDVWGNRWNQNLTAGTGYTVNNSFDPAHTNHVAGWTYDVAGNVLWDGAHSYTYDPEGRILTVDGTTQYLYGPDGSRAQVIKSSGSRDYVYTPSGQLSSIWNGGALVKANVYAGGAKLGSYTGSGISFEYADWTGSTRVVTNSAGNPTATYNSVPFGLLSPSSTGSDQAEISGLDWDIESQSGHAWARQYNPKSAVWLSPDPYNGSYDFTNPQSLNRYAYVGNNPMSFSDPLGLARYNDAAGGPDDPFAAFSDFYGNLNSQTIGCRPGDGDACRGIRVAWDWLRSHFGGSSDSGDPSGNESGGGFGFGSRSTALIFQTSSHILTPAEVTQRHTNAANNSFTFTLNSQSMSSLVGPSGVPYAAFSGEGSSRNDPSKTGDAGSGPLPKGLYYIVDRPSGGRATEIRDLLHGTNRETWFGLFRADGQVDDQTTVHGTVRGNFRLHPIGPLGISEGCVTLNSLSSFIAISFQLMSAEPATIPGTNIRYYGTVTVK